jgi:hypothetical protein
MATGAGFGPLVMAVLPLVGVVTLLRARRKRRAGAVLPDVDGEARRAAAAEMERRMASYLAQRELGERVVAPVEEINEQETRR